LGRCIHWQVGFRLKLVILSHFFANDLISDSLGDAATHDSLRFPVFDAILVPALTLPPLPGKATYMSSSSTGFNPFFALPNFSTSAHYSSNGNADAFVSNGTQNPSGNNGSLLASNYYNSYLNPSNQSHPASGLSGNAKNVGGAGNASGLNNPPGFALPNSIAKAGSGGTIPPNGANPSDAVTHRPLPFAQSSPEIDTKPAGLALGLLSGILLLMIEQKRASA